MRIHIITLLNFETIQHPHKDEIQLAIREQAARTHPVPEAVGEERGVGLLEPALGTEGLGVGAPDLGVHVAGPGVEEDDGAGGDGLAVVDDVFDGGPREREAQDDVVAQQLFAEGADVGALVVVVGVAERGGDWVVVGNFGEGFGLDVGSLGEEGDAPCDECGEGVEAAGEHGQADRGEFFGVEFGFFVQDDVCLDARLVLAFIHAVVEVLVQLLEIDVAAASHVSGLGGPG